MRKQIFAFGLLVFCTGVIKAQNTFPATGNVGIGTNSPSSLLDVNGNVQIASGANNTGTNSAFIIRGPNSPTDYNSYQDIHYKFTSAGSAKIRSYRGSSWGTYLQFLTNSNTGSSDAPQVAMHIDATGYVGIGTTTPQYNLDVTGAIRATNSLNIFSDQFGKHIQFKNSTGSSTTWWMGLSDAQGSYFSIGDGSSNTNRLVILKTTGNVLIGKTSQVNSSYILDVNGYVRANKVVVNTTGADFVFEPSYKLMPLDKLELFLLENHHLPGVEPAIAMQNNGIDLGNNQTVLLQKTEELTLYIIEQNKQLTDQSKKLEQQDKLIAAQQALLQQLLEELQKQKQDIAALKTSGVK